MHECFKFILFWNDTLNVSNGLSVHHQEFETVHTATGICQTDSSICKISVEYRILYIVYGGGANKVYSFINFYTASALYIYIYIYMCVCVCVCFQ